jgi:plastocyanin
MLRGEWLQKRLWLVSLGIGLALWLCWPFDPTLRAGLTQDRGWFNTLAAEASGVITGSVTIGGKVEPSIKDAVISVAGVPATLVPQEKMAREKKALMDQKDMVFVPHVLPVLVGTTVDFPNSDTVYHNVFSVSAAKRFDLGLYPQGETRSTTFDKPGVVTIRCNTHPKMEAYVVVKEHPYFTVANERGVYRLSDIPLGSYTIQVWHPRFGIITQPFTLERSEQVLSLNFDLEKAR